MPQDSRTEVKKLRKFIADPKLKTAHKMMRVVSGVSRFSILMMLKKFGGTVTVSDLAAALGTSCSLVSHEMHILRSHNLVTCTWKGREAYYKASPKLKGMLPDV